MFWPTHAPARMVQEQRLDPEERAFIANVVNRLAVSQDAVPTPEHRKWLLHIKERLGIK